MEPILVQTYYWPEILKIKHLPLLLVSHVGATCGRGLKAQKTGYFIKYSIKMILVIYIRV